MIAELNRLVDFIEAHLSDDIDAAELAKSLGTTEYHLRRLFSSLAGMPLSDYIRRRRMTVAAADLVDGGRVLDIAVRYGYGSTEAFGRAFRMVHGVSPGDVRRHGGPLRAQAKLRFRLTVEGNITMDTRIADRPAFRLVGHAARVPLIHQGVNPHIQAHIASLPAAEHARLKALSSTEPSGLLQVSADVDPDYTEGSELTYLHGVALDLGAAPSRSGRDRRPGGRMGGVPHLRPLPRRSAGDVGGHRGGMVPFEPLAPATGPLDRGRPRARRRLQHRDHGALDARRARVAGLFAQCGAVGDQPSPQAPPSIDSAIVTSLPSGRSRGL